MCWEWDGRDLGSLEQYVSCMFYMVFRFLAVGYRFSDSWKTRQGTVRITEDAEDAEDTEGFLVFLGFFKGS